MFFLLLYQLIYIILYLYSRIVPFIGENIVKVEDIKEWLNIKDILLKRAQENKPYSEYHISIAKFFIWYILY